MIDAHIHLDKYPQEEVHRLIEEWHESGIGGIVAVSSNLSSAYQTLAWQQEYPTFVYAAVGYHPEQPLPKSNEMAELLTLIKKEKSRIAAIGEVGLPHYELEKLGTSSLDAYVEMLSIFAETARVHELPLILHAVHDKAAIALDILMKKQIEFAHFHWLKAPSNVVQQIVQEGYYISVTPEVCYRERDQQLVAQVPLQQLMVETDGPWSFSGPFSNQETTPLLLFEVVRKVAEIKGITVNHALRHCQQNARVIFKSLHH